MNTLYKIYTEDKNIKGIRKIIKDYYKNFTISKGKGFWQGIEEKSLIIEIIGKNNDKKIIKQLSSNIKILNNQKAVLYSSQSIISNLV